MPQLNPIPWFMVFVLVWITLMMLFMKTLNSKPHPTTSSYNKQPNNPKWTWPWY